MSESAKHPVTLRFLDDDLESQFIQDYVEKSRKPIEVGLIAGILVYGVLYGIMDWVLSTNALSQIWILRGSICAMALGLISYSRYSKNLKYFHEAVSVLIFIAGFGLMVMILLDDSPGAYLDGPVLLVMPAYVLLRLRFIYATTVGLLFFVLYCVVIYFVEGMRATDLLASAIFLFAANLIGMVAGYALENYARKEFWQTLVIDKERKANAELLEVKNRFFANISHEIRTPLTLIVGPLGDLLDDYRDAFPSKAVRVLKAARRNGDRLLKFINQLLDLSRVDAEQMPASFHRADLIDFLQTEVENFLPFAASRGVALAFLHDEGSIEFVSDYEKLDIVVSNLVSNAIKYTPRGGIVRVTAAQNAPNDGVVIEVKDNGAGIPSDAQEHIFDRFYRVPSSSKNNKEGLGLGLSLTKAMVLQLSGNIEVDSEKGLGSVFTVLLPALSESDKEIGRLEDFEVDQNRTEGRDQEAVSGAANNESSGDGLASVLIVEDDQEVRSYLRECLAAYTVFEASNGAEGLKLVEQHMPDLVVSDLMMPNMDGRQFVKMIRSNMVLSHIPFIMLTANVSEEVRLENLEEGVDDYLTKPFNKKELQLRVRNMLAARERMQKANHAHVTMEPSLEEVQSSERVFLERLRTLINEHLGDEHFNADALADELGVSVRQLQRKTKALLDETPTALIRVMRLKKAGHLLEASYGTVSEVAYAVGFNNPTYFTKCFREYFGEAPSQWIKQ